MTPRGKVPPGHGEDSNERARRRAPIRTPVPVPAPAKAVRSTVQDLPARSANAEIDHIPHSYPPDRTEVVFSYAGERQKDKHSLTLEARLRAIAGEFPRPWLIEALAEVFRREDEAGKQ